MSPKPQTGGMADDVLVIFEDEHKERQAAIAKAVKRLGETHNAPRIEQYTDKANRERFMLVRTDGDVARLSTREARAVTTRFTPDEWAVIEQAVLLRYGLALADLKRGEK